MKSLTYSIKVTIDREKESNTSFFEFLKADQKRKKAAMPLH
jgi:hypothetical protein